MDAGDLGSSQSDPQGNSMQKEPLQGAAFITELSIPSFVKTDLGPKLRMSVHIFAVQLTNTH